MGVVRYGTIRNGEWDGEVREYNGDRLSRGVVYKNGVQTGASKTYRFDGTLAVERVPYEDGQSVTEIHYDASGKMEEYRLVRGKRGKVLFDSRKAPKGKQEQKAELPAIPAPANGVYTKEPLDPSIKSAGYREGYKIDGHWVGEVREYHYEAGKPPSVIYQYDNEGRMRQQDVMDIFDLSVLYLRRTLNEDGSGVLERFDKDGKVVERFAIDDKWREVETGAEEKAEPPANPAPAKESWEGKPIEAIVQDIRAIRATPRADHTSPLLEAGTFQQEDGSSRTVENNSNRWFTVYQTLDGKRIGEEQEWERRFNDTKRDKFDDFLTLAATTRYDKNGNPIEMLSYDPDGRIHGRARFRLWLGEDGYWHDESVDSFVIDEEGVLIKRKGKPDELLPLDVLDESNGQGGNTALSVGIREQYNPEGEGDLAGLAGNVALSIGGRTTGAEFNDVRPADVGRQRRAGAYYPDIGGWIANTAFSLGARRKQEYRAVIAKKRPDLPVAEVDAFMAEVEKLGDTKAEKAALHWFVKGGLQLPEDHDVMARALKAMEWWGLSWQNFKSPQALLMEAKSRLETWKAKPTESPIDPDTVPELTNKYDIGNGFVIYDVDDSREGQLAMWKIVKSHLGMKRAERPQHPDRANRDPLDKLAWVYWSPWCLLTPTENGDGPSESAWRFWSDPEEGYTYCKKRVAFKDGKLFAFCASNRLPSEWWDLGDETHEDRIGGLAEVDVDSLGYEIEDENGDIIEGTVTANVEVSEDDGHELEIIEGEDHLWLSQGDKNNGVYREWDDSGRVEFVQHVIDGDHVEPTRYSPWQYPGWIGFEDKEVDIEINRNPGKNQTLNIYFIDKNGYHSRHIRKDYTDDGKIEVDVSDGSSHYSARILRDGTAIGEAGTKTPAIEELLKMDLQNGVELLYEHVNANRAKHGLPPLDVPSAPENTAFSLTYRELQAMPAVSADGVRPITDKAHLKETFRRFGVVTNGDDGRKALFPAASAGKFMSSTGERAEFILPLLGELYKTAKFVTSSPWKPHKRADGTMSKTHANYVRYNYYLNNVVRDGKEYYVRLDVTEQKNATNKVHSGTFSKVEIYEKNGDLVSALGQEPSGIKPPFHDPKIAEWLKEINEKGYAGTNPDVKPANTALSVGGFGLNANARAEMEKVRRRYAGTEQWMKAPNGQPTKLNERQWLQVRTPSFKAWFGDWENDPANASKVVDENGEPLVVYHQTNSKAYINRETGQEWDRITPEERQAWRDRSDWDEHWEEQDFYTFDNTTHGRRSIEMPAFFFSPEYDEYHEYGNRTVAAFLNLRNPASNPEIPNAGVTYTAGEDAMNALMKQGYDGFIRDDDGAVYEINAFRPEQIKSATDNVGTFDPENPDIRFSMAVRPERAPAMEAGGDVREAGEGALAWLRRKFVHSQSPVFEAVRRVMGVGGEPPDRLNVEAAAKNVHGKIRARQELLQRAYLEPLKAILAQPGMDRRRFDDYALALHALERNRMIQERSVVVDPTTDEVVDLGVEAGSGVTTAWAERVIREAERDPFAAQYKEAAQILAEMNRFVLRGAVADGLLTEAQARTWMRLSPHYVPLKSGGAAPGAIHKRATGRFTRPDSVLVNSMRQAYATVRNGELNRVNKTMADWIREYDPNGEQVGGTVPESHKHAKIKMTDPQYVPKGSTAEALLRERGIGQIGQMGPCRRNAPNLPRLSANQPINQLRV